MPGVYDYSCGTSKGWKLPDMMFATRRSLSDATNAVAKQLEIVYSSLAKLLIHPGQLLICHRRLCLCHRFQIKELQSSLPASPKVFQDVAEEARNAPPASNGLNISEASSSSCIFGRTFSGFSCLFSPNRQ
ncbi:hypothetical protein L1987_41579 [Smallanthus sonchifolius]|uniref:Uncharacterized protein n=1 Tax=Smallanthus sonchifolius TaxID=185202 RepID=A0ACB9GUE2_9ASTR|nr:hypothetical protein L1987_41579 [Smallanthus sonchifolius]